MNGDVVAGAQSAPVLPVNRDGIPLGAIVLGPNGPEGWVNPALDQDELAQVLVALFAKVGERPDLDLLKFQLAMARSMHAMAKESPAAESTVGDPREADPGTPAQPG